MQKEVSWKISYMGFLSTVVIFLHHANLGSYVQDESAHKAVFMDFFTWLVIIAMSWFVFISAYLFFRGIKLGDLPRKLYNRVYSLMVPFLIWNTIAVILKIFNHKQIFGNGLWGLIRNNYLFWNGSGVADGPLWFVFRLLTYIACAPLIYCICTGRGYRIKFGIVFWGLVLYNCAVRTGYFTFLFFLPHYLVGAYLGINCSGKFEKLLGGGVF